MYLDATHTWEKVEAGRRHGHTLYDASFASAQDSQTEDMSIFPSTHCADLVVPVRMLHIVFTSFDGRWQ